MLYPLRDKIDFSEFIMEVKDFTFEVGGELKEDGYVVIEEVTFVLPSRTRLPVVETFYCDGFTIIVNCHTIIITVKKGFWFDGSTLSIDTDDRMVFSLLHDCACLASQSSRINIYERLLDNVAYEIIRKQGPWYNWFRAWRTEVAVRAWDSFEG